MNLFRIIPFEGYRVQRRCGFYCWCSWKYRISLGVDLTEVSYQTKKRVMEKQELLNLKFC